MAPPAVTGSLLRSRASTKLHQRSGWEPAVLGRVMELVATTSGMSRSDVARMTGWSRSTVSQRVDALLRLGLLLDGERRSSDVGRPATSLRINPQAGVVLSADIGAMHCTLAVADLGADIVAEQTLHVRVSAGPDAVMGEVLGVWHQQLSALGLGPDAVRAVGIGVPGPVAFATGTVVRPPIMPGWDGYTIPTAVAQAFPVTVLTDNDVNIMALGEHRQRGAASDDMLFIKLGTGIGCGIISGGKLHRGSTGAAGDIGHIRLPEASEVVCSCGHTGCLEAAASGAALARQMRELGYPAEKGTDVLALAEAGNQHARRAIRVAGRQLGEVLASIVSFHNPKTIVIGGDLAQSHDDLIAQARSAIYGRALPLATRELAIEPAVLGDRAGVVGGVVLALTHVFSSAGVTALLEPVTHP